LLRWWIGWGKALKVKGFWDEGCRIIDAGQGIVTQKVANPSTGCYEFVRFFEGWQPYCEQVKANSYS